MRYNFDEIVDRNNTLSVKYGLRKKIFGKEDVIPLWVADMDFKTPDFIASAIKERASHEIYGYSYRPESFYTSARQWVKKRHNWDIDYNWMTFTPGIVPAVNLAVLEFTDPGDKIMIQPPVYFPFFHAVKKNNRTLIENRLQLRDGRLQIDFDDFEKQVKSGVKMFILSNPHNPGGNVWTQEELKRMGELCMENNVLIIADEIHSDIVFPGYQYTPMASLSPEIAEQTLTFIAPSKTFNIAGLATSLGIISNKTLRERFNTILDSIHIANGNLFGTVALEAAYTHGEEWLEQLLVYLRGNLDYLTEFIEKEIPQIKVIQPEGTYLVWLDCRELPIADDEIHKFMIEKAGLAFNDGASFGENGKGFQRLNFGCPKSTLEEAMQKMKRAVFSIQ